MLFIGENFCDLVEIHIFDCILLEFILVYQHRPFSVFFILLKVQSLVVILHFCQTFSLLNFKSFHEQKLIHFNHLHVHQIQTFSTLIFLLRIFLPNRSSLVFFILTRHHIISSQSWTAFIFIHKLLECWPTWPESCIDFYI